MNSVDQLDRGLFIRQAVPADAVALARFAEDTFRDAFAAGNDPDDMAVYCASAFAPEIQGAQIADAAIETLVVADAGGDFVAYAQLREGAPEVASGPAPIELWRFYVTAAHRGRGIAQRLMTAVMDAARARGAETLWLGVWEYNVRAQKFYRKYDFVDIGAHTFALGRDRQTDRLMALDLTRNRGSEVPKFRGF